MSLLIVSLALVVITSVVLLFRTQIGILIAFFSKPIIDASWNVAIAGMNAPKIMSGLFPILIFLNARGRGKKLSDMPLFGLWMTYVVFILLSSTSALFSSGIYIYMDQVLRVMNGFVGFYMLQAYFTDRESFKKLLKVLLIASLFPLSVAMYQFATGVVIHERIAVGFIRNVGFYHDAIVPRQYIFLTLIAIMLYWYYFLEKGGDFFKKVALLCLGVIAILALYKLYTKAGYLILVLWTMILIISQKRFASMAGTLLVVMLLAALLFEIVSEVAGQVYWKELSALQNNEDVVSEERVSKRTFSGRWYVWEKTLDEYFKSSFFAQLIGIGHGVGAHNDFLNRLISNGLIGLILYISLLISIGIRVVNNYLRRKDPLNIAALMLLTMWMVDTIGLVPSAYTAYQWYVWGFIGLSFCGVNFYSDERENFSESVKEKPLGTGRVKYAVKRTI